jgi:predicted enzyme related to lactoylglutathione lyase
VTAPFWGPTLDCPDPLQLGDFYQRVPQQCHLDFSAADLDAEQERVIAAGATPTAVQPAPQTSRVFLDPAGHPFCLTTWRTPSGPPESR